MTSYRDRDSEKITILPDDCHGQSVTIKNMRHSSFEALGTLGAVYLYDCVDCTVNLRYVKSACNVYSCSNLILTILW